VEEFADARLVEQLVGEERFAGARVGFLAEEPAEEQTRKQPDEREAGFPSASSGASFGKRACPRAQKYQLATSR